ncbi:hypothetical protein [Orlajensenia leifsoniae]|uniref:Uncharacterized protein n=1 Tax=Orlajensenia leifsoniae TaxID=2561933 RepID=A0A4Y9R6G4_9MICO|nr:hypothetical protein [Leifsonia flava]TFV99887.1 hypothetical protein E4M00_01395 [Leifsonia flava]
MGSQVAVGQHRLPAIVGVGGFDLSDLPTVTKVKNPASPDQVKDLRSTGGCVVRSQPLIGRCEVRLRHGSNYPLTAQLGRVIKAARRIEEPPQVGKEFTISDLDARKPIVDRDSFYRRRPSAKLSGHECPVLWSQSGDTIVGV